MELDPLDLDKISAITLQHYDAHAEDFRDGTCDHDVTQNIAALLHHIEVEPPLTILDFGCGPGRDLMAFTTLGHCAVGLDGAERFVAMARDATGCDVWQQDFLHLDLPAAQFDGIFANAALFHVPSQALPRVLRQLHATLKPGGVLFSSNPRGTNQEGWSHGRYGVFHDLEAWRRYMATRASSKSSTITGPPGCRASGSRGSPACGASRLPETPGGFSTGRPRWAWQMLAFKPL